MAGLVPAIHAVHIAKMRGGRAYIVTNMPIGMVLVGVTSDLSQRVWHHRTGEFEGSAKCYGLDGLVCYETFPDIRDAIQRERNSKHRSRAWKVRLILDLNPKLTDLYEELDAPGVPFGMAWMAGTSPAMTTLLARAFIEIT